MRRSHYRVLGSVAVAMCMLAAPGIGQVHFHDQATEHEGDVMRFDGHMVVRAMIESDADLETMMRMSPDVWSHSVGVGGPVDFRIPAERIGELDAAGIGYEVLIPDVQVLINRERASLNTQDEDADWFDNYKSYDDVMSYLDDLAALRPDLAQVMDLGDSYQGRSIKAIRISSASNDVKPGVFYNGCQHAREWITVMMTTYMADRLIKTYDSDPDVKFLVDNFEFYIVPIVNPDGYSYTWTNNRLWRKNRRPGGGVDLNRNWGVGWGGPGSSDRMDSQVYRGTGPFSEPETQVIRNFAMAHPNILFHNDVHSYSQLILWPWGYTPENCPDYDTFNTIGNDMKDAIFDVHGMTYNQGPVFHAIYPASGVMCDWMYGDQFAFSVSYELRDRGQYGFILPREQIIPNSEEAFAGMVEHVLASVTPYFEVGGYGDLSFGGYLDVMSAGNAPGEEVYFFASIRGIYPGGTYIENLNVTLEISNAIFLGTDVADGGGYAMVGRGIPNLNRNWLRIFLQAAKPSETSNWMYVDVRR